MGVEHSWQATSGWLAICSQVPTTGTGTRMNPPLLNQTFWWLIFFRYKKCSSTVVRCFYQNQLQNSASQLKNHSTPSSANDVFFWTPFALWFRKPPKILKPLVCRFAQFRVWESLWPQGLKDSETGNFWIPTNALWLPEFERWKNPWGFWACRLGRDAFLEGLPEVRGGWNPTRRRDRVLKISTWKWLRHIVQKMLSIFDSFLVDAWNGHSFSKEWELRVFPGGGRRGCPPVTKALQ